MDDALRKLAQSVKVIRSLHRSAGGDVEGYATKGAVIPHDSMERDENLGKFLQGSRVRNGEGEHVVLYHITPKDFDTFKAGGDDPELSGPGIWLSPNKHHLPAAHNVGGGSKGYDTGTNVMPVYANIKSPLVLDTRDMIDWAKTSYGAGSEFPLYLRPEVKQKLIEDGYDGIFYAGGRGVEYGTNGIGVGEQPNSEEEVIAFHPHQIKSATGNNGNFDSANPDITKSGGGDVEAYATKGAVTDPLEIAKSVKLVPVGDPKQDVDDYRGQHEAPDRENGVPLHDTSGVYPPDFYGPNGFRYYADYGNDYDYRSYNAHVRLKDKPEEFVSVHRAIPSDVYKKALKEDAPLRHMIRPGDWVTPSKEYAKEHGEAQFGKNYKIASMRVKAKDVFTNGDSINEWGYDPDITKSGGGNVEAYGDGGSTHEPHQRAEEQGYSIKGYHFTRGQRAENIAKTGKFDPTRSFNPDEEATFFWTHPDAANEWAHIHGSGAYPNTPMGEDALNRRNPVIMPVRVNPGKHIDIDWLEHSKNLQSPENYNSQLMGNLINHAKRNGYDTMRIRNMGEGMSQPHDQLAVLNPAMIRSEFAQFDPARQHENDIGAHTGGYIKGYATKGAVMDPLELAKSVKPLHRSGGGRDDAPKEPTIGSILKRGQPIQPSTPNPTPAEITAARADTRTSAQHVNQRLNTIVPESSRVVGGTYSAGAPNGGRWADLPQQFLNQPGIGFKITPQIRQADALHKRALADLEQNPNSEFHKAAVNQTGSNLAEAHKGGDAVLQHLWGQAVNESSQAAKNAVAQHGVKPMFGSHDWDQSMSLPLRDHLWYELSGEKMAENLPDLTPSEYLKGMDLVGATSARAEPGENLERGLGVLSQHLRGVPADVDLTIPSTVRQALSRSHTGGSSALPGNKTGHFSDTLALTGGVPTRFPISVNDVWVGKMFGVPDDVMSSNQSLHEPMALYFNKIRDLYNNVHGHELPFKYQSWNFQAPAWVHLRNEPSGDAYHQVWGGIINKLQKAGVPGIQGDKITREALMHPKFADALRRTTEGFRSSPKATVEFGTTQTPIGAQAAELYHHAVENGDQISQDQYLKGLTTAMFQSSRGKHPWDMLKKAVTGDVTGASDITRISTPTSDSPFDSGGTFEGAVSPNIRVPLKGMDDEQIAMMHAIAGHHLKQDAMATSTVHMANSNEEPREDHVRGHSLFVPTTDPIHPEHIRSLAKALSANGHDMSFTRHPNGYMFDTIPRFDDEGAHGIDHDTLRQAANQSLGNLYPTGKIMAHDFKSVYNPSSEYADYKSKLLKRMHDDFTRESFDQEPSENNARKAIVGPKGPNPPSGRSKKAWNTYTQRLNYLAAAEEGFKDLASRVNNSHSKFIGDATKRMSRAGIPFTGPLRTPPSEEPEHEAHGGYVGPTWHDKLRHHINNPLHVHPAYHIHGTHIREEIHGKPVFTGEL